MNTESELNEKYFIRNLEKEDYNKGYFNLLGQLTKAPEPSFEDWAKRFDLINKQEMTKIIVIESKEDNKVVGTISLMFEYKFIRNLGMIGHIEDFVVDEKCRGLKFGKILIEKAIEEAKNRGCYKILLDANDSVAGFYEKIGFSKNSNGMSIYF